MEIILQQDVDELGFEGDIVQVAKGYARNYLIPKGVAVLATAQNIKIFEQKKKKIEIKRLKAKEAAETLRDELEGMEVRFTQKSGEEGKLYGSITSMDIASQMEKQGIVIDRRKILLEKPIKALGAYDVQVKVFPEVTAAIKVIVDPEEEKEKA
jgi:large subunit ribosomal protein L9